MSYDLYENDTLHIGTYAGPAGGDRRRLQITAWTDGERTYVALTPCDARKVLSVLLHYFRGQSLLPDMS